MFFKKNSSTVVATVFHKQALDNINLFLKSLEQQNDKDFDLIILNDDIKNLFSYIKSNMNIKIINCFGSINENRISMIRHCKKMKYKNVVFIDSDDYVDRKRIFTAKKYLVKNNVVINDINLINSKKKTLKKNFFSHRIKNNSLITINDILDKNFIGMSNSSAKTKIFEKIKLKKLTFAPIFDWALWFSVLKISDGIFTNETNTYYKPNTPKNITSLINYKINHNLRKFKKKKQLTFLNIKEATFIQKKTTTNIKKYQKNNNFWWEESLSS